MKSEALTTQQSEAIVHLLDAPSVAEAARQAGVARATDGAYCFRRPSRIRWSPCSHTG